MTADHRVQMALKRGKASQPEEGLYRGAIYMEQLISL